MKFNSLKLFVLTTLILISGSYFNPTPAHALATCGTVDNPEITVNINGTDYTSNASVTVPKGTAVSFNVKTYAEPSSVNTISYPVGSNIYPGPNRSTGRNYTTVPINSSGETINVWVDQNCQEDWIDADGPHSVPRPEYEMSVTLNIPPENILPVCSISSFTADNLTPPNNTSTTLRFSFQDTSTSPPSTTTVFPWDITLIGGTGLPSPNSGTGVSDTSSTGNLTAQKIYRLTCGSTFQDLTVTPSNPGGGSTCQDTSANNFGGALPCTYPPAATCQDTSANNFGGALPCTYPATVQASGYLDTNASGTNNCSFLGGWAWDPDFPNNATSVHIYKNSVFYDAIAADANKGDLPGNHKHAFTYPIPSDWKTGTNQTINVYVIDLNGDGNPELNYSPATLNCASAPIIGACAAPHYTCFSGAIANNSSNASTWTWDCNGLNGGANDSCSEDKPIVPPVTCQDTSANNFGGALPCIYMSGTLTASNCTIPLGNSSCNTNLNWNTDNPVGTSAVTTPTNITVATGNSGSTTYPVAKGTRDFYLYNNNIQLAQATASADCAPGIIWNGSVCSTPVVGAATINVTADVPSYWQLVRVNLPGGQQQGLDWYGPALSNSYSITDFGDYGLSAYSPCYTTDWSPRSFNIQSGDTREFNIVNTPDGSCPVCVPNQGASCASAPNSCGQTNTGTVQCNGSCNAPTPPNSSCPVNGGWSPWSPCSVTACGSTGTQTRTCTNPTPSNGGADCSSLDGVNSSKTCNTVACPSGTLSATSCTVAGSASTCDSFVTWSTSNLTSGATEVTRNNPANTVISSATSGTNISNTVKYGSSSFFLYHDISGTPTRLAEANMNASCSAGTIWDGSKCKITSSMSGTLTPATPSCSIGQGQSNCSINFSWDTLNPISTSNVTRNPANTVVGTGNSGINVPFVVKYNIETFYLNNNTRELARSTVTSNCTSGTTWNGTKCVLILVGICQDSAATNYGSPLPCVYPPGGICQDSAANNFGGPLPCNYGG